VTLYSTSPFSPFASHPSFLLFPFLFKELWGGPPLWEDFRQVHFFYLSDLSPEELSFHCTRTPGQRVAFSDEEGRCIENPLFFFFPLPPLSLFFLRCASKGLHSPFSHEKIMSPTASSSPFDFPGRPHRFAPRFGTEISAFFPPFPCLPS